MSLTRSTSPVSFFHDDGDIGHGQSGFKDPWYHRTAGFSVTAAEMRTPGRFEERTLSYRRFWLIIQVNVCCVSNFIKPYKRSTTGGRLRTDM